MRPESRYEFRIHMNVLCGMSVFGFRLICVPTVDVVNSPKEQPYVYRYTNITYIGLAKPMHDSIKMYYVLFSRHRSIDIKHKFDPQMFWLRCVCTRQPQQAFPA